MKVQTRYRVHQHHKFEHGGRKYAADMESEAIVEINDVEWELLNRDLTETLYVTVEGLKSQFKSERVFEGIERLQQFSERGHLLSPTTDTKTASQPPETLKVLVPFQFVSENSNLDPVTNENRYHLLAALSKHVELETFSFGSESSDHDFGEFVSNRNINIGEDSNFWFPWYAMDRYDGILLFGQFPDHDILYYSKNLPILRCLESDRLVQNLVLESALNSQMVQKNTDLLLPKASWLTNWLSDFGVAPAGMHTISEGITVVEPIGKALAKQHAAVLTENLQFAKQPVVGLISGFKPNTGLKVISALATSNPHLSFFVYDSILAEHYRNPLNNVVFFGADDEVTRSVLPIFFQAFDLICFPAVPGTPPSLVLEAMAYGTPAVVISEYGIPPEIEGAGVLVECRSTIENDLEVPIPQVSKKINQLLTDTKRSGKYKQIAKGFASKYTWEHTAREIVQLFRQSTARAGTINPLSEQDLSPLLFCQYYDPRTGTTYPSAYRQEIDRFEPLENAVAEVLARHHTPAEVELVFKHFQQEIPRAGNGLNRSG